MLLAAVTTEHWAGTTGYSPPGNCPETSGEQPGTCAVLCNHNRRLDTRDTQTHNCPSVWANRPCLGVSRFLCIYLGSLHISLRSYYTMGQMLINLQSLLNTIQAHIYFCFASSLHYLTSMNSRKVCVCVKTLFNFVGMFETDISIHRHLNSGSNIITVRRFIHVINNWHLLSPCCWHVEWFVAYWRHDLSNAEMQRNQLKQATARRYLWRCCLAIIVWFSMPTTKIEYLSNYIRDTSTICKIFVIHQL